MRQLLIDYIFETRVKVYLNGRPRTL